MKKAILFLSMFFGKHVSAQNIPLSLLQGTWVNQDLSESLFKDLSKFSQTVFLPSFIYINGNREFVFEYRIEQYSSPQKITSIEKKSGY